MSQAIKDRIQKLFAVANDHAATEDEAATAMRLAMQLMLKYGIDESEVNRKAGNTAKRKATTGNEVEADARYERVVAQAAAHLYGCRTVIYSGLGKASFIGREENRGAAEMTFRFLLDQVEALYKVALPKGLTKAARAEFRRTFKEACALRVHRRAEAMVEEMETNNAAAVKATGSTALVVVAHRKELEQEVAEFMEAQNYRTSRRTTFRGGSGTAAGRAAGDKVNLHRQVK